MIWPTSHFSRFWILFYVFCLKWIPSELLLPTLEWTKLCFFASILALLGKLHSAVRSVEERFCTLSVKSEVDKQLRGLDNEPKNRLVIHHLVHGHFKISALENLN